MNITVFQYADNLWPGFRRDKYSTQGFDTAASEAKYAELVEKEIKRRYPDANVTVFCDSNQSSAICVDPKSATTESEVAEVAQRIFESNEWYVDLPRAFWRKGTNVHIQYGLSEGNDFDTAFGESAEMGTYCALSDEEHVRMGYERLTEAEGLVLMQECGFSATD